MSSEQQQQDSHFVSFAESLSASIKLLERGDDSEFLERQKRQVEELVALETRFRDYLRVMPAGRKVYEAFISFIRDECHNILDARPYFRERQTVFTPHIANALKNRDVDALMYFGINYRFVRFAASAASSILWEADSEVLALAAAIEKVRTELVVLNMPLAIARARIFYSKTPRSHLELMDLVQIACLGLMSGIDKFVLPYSRMFRGVAIGRMVGDFIEQYSATMIHLFPSDKRILYNVNKIAGRQTEALDLEVVAEQVNQLLDPARKTTAAEVSDLMSAASCISMEATAGDEDDGIRVADAVAAPMSWQPDVMYEKQDTMRKLVEAISALSLFERKLLRLRGVDLVA